MTGLDAGTSHARDFGRYPDAENDKRPREAASWIASGVVSTNLRLDAPRGRQTMPCYFTRGLHAGGRSSRWAAEHLNLRAPVTSSHAVVECQPQGELISEARRVSVFVLRVHEPCKGDDIYARGLHSGQETRSYNPLCVQPVARYHIVWSFESHDYARG